MFLLGLASNNKKIDDEVKNWAINKKIDDAYSLNYIITNKNIYTPFDGTGQVRNSRCY